MGPEAELKITHQLWPPEDGVDSRPTTSRSKLSLLTTDNTKLEPDQQERKKAIIIAARPENKAAGVLATQVLDHDGRPVRLFAKSSVIYSNARDAQILRPNQLPSVARGRKPLAVRRISQRFPTYGNADFEIVNRRSKRVVSTLPSVFFAFRLLHYVSSWEHRNASAPET